MNNATRLINDAKQYAREAINETWPTAREVAVPTAGMYEFDAILIDDEAYSIASVSIMHDPDATRSLSSRALAKLRRASLIPKRTSRHRNLLGPSIGTD